MARGFKIGIATGAGLPSSPSQNAPATGLSDLEKLVAAGAQHLRGGIAWAKLDSGLTGAFGTSATEVKQLRFLDLYIRDCNDAGVEVILQLSGVGGQPNMGNPVYYEPYANLIARVLDRYSTGNGLGTGGADLEIVGVECGNETAGVDWDSQNYLGGPGDNDGANTTSGAGAYARLMSLIYAQKQSGWPAVILGGIAAPPKGNAKFIGGAQFTHGLYEWWNANGFGSPNSGSTQYPYDMWNSHRYTWPQTASFAMAHSKSDGRGWPIGTLGTSTHDVEPNWAAYPNIYGALSVPNSGSEQIRLANGDGSSGPGPNKKHAVTEYGVPVAPDNLYNQPTDPKYDPTIPVGGIGVEAEQFIAIWQDAIALYSKEPGRCYLTCFTDFDNTNDKGRMWGLYYIDEVTPKPAVFDAFKASASGDPYVATVSPTFGPPGTSVTLTGLGFTGATSVKFGTTSASSVVVVDDGTITCTAPSTSGTVDVTVTTPQGTSVINPPHQSGGVLVTGDQFTYTIVGVPIVSGLSPNHGTASGATSVAITGTGFTGVSGATGVKFGATNATSYTVNSDTSITATAPAGTGVVRVKVTNANGTSTNNGAFDDYTYNPVAAVVPWGICISASWTYATQIANRVKALWDAAGNTGERIVRVQPEWDGAQPGSFAGTLPGQNDAFDWSHFNPVIDANAAAGNKILWTIGYCPSGLHTGTTDKVYPNRDAAFGYRDVANYAWSLVNHAETRAPGVTKGVEVWNEPSSGFLQPVSVSNYTAMLKTVYAAVKTGVIQGRANRAGYASVLVGTAGIWSSTGGGPTAADQWHQGIIDNGGGNSFDFAGMHPYFLQCPPTNTSQYSTRQTVLPKLRTVLDNAGRSTCPIWLTEDGCFNRPDSTPTNTGDTANCGTRGLTRAGWNTATQGADPLTIEITETETATRIAELSAWLGTVQTLLKGGPEILFELEDLNDNTHTGDWADHAGIYGYSPTHSGVVKTVIHDAFVTALGSTPTRTAPSCAITAPPDDPTHAAPLQGTATLFIINASDTVDAPETLLVNLYRDNGATLMPGTGDNGGNCSYSALSGWFYLLDTTTLADGNYLFAARATNSAGQTTLSNQPNGIRAAINNNTGGLPTVTSVTNDATGLPSGSTSGGDSVHITGTGFTGVSGATGVKFGATNATSYSVVDDQTITAVTPAKTAGTYDVKVTNGTGTSTTTAGDQFSYTSTGTGPVITGITPSTGDISGGDAVVILGSGFTGATQVKFGTSNAAAYVVNSDTQITATNPAHAAGSVDVSVTTGVGTSGISPADVFTYATLPDGLTATVVAVTTSDGTTYNAPNIPQPVPNVTGTIKLAFQVTGGTASQLDVYEGLDDPYGPNLLGSATPLLGLWGYELDTNRLSSGQIHRIQGVPSVGSASGSGPGS